MLTNIPLKSAKTCSPTWARFPQSRWHQLCHPVSSVDPCRMALAGLVLPFDGDTLQDVRVLPTKFGVFVSLKELFQVHAFGSEIEQDGINGRIRALTFWLPIVFQGFLNSFRVGNSFGRGFPAILQPVCCGCNSFSIFPSVLSTRGWIQPWTARTIPIRSFTCFQFLGLRATNSLFL